jgi:hypothetical protein
MDALKARGDRDYPTGCQCCWQFSSHRDNMWSFMETLLNHINDVFAGFMENRMRYEEAAAAERERKA